MDYTNRRLGSRTERGHKVVRCPKCGRKGEGVRYTDGTAVIVHKTRSGPFWFVEVTDRCMLAYGEMP
jgi:hypothetical protein